MDITLSRAAPLRAGIASVPLLRAMALPLLRKLDRPITIAHPYVGTRLHLLSYTHKGYWYYGRAREAATMRRIARIVRPGDTVIDAGGHIGYTAQYLSHLAGPRGRVHIFEPGSENTRFLTRNIMALPNTLHIKAALTATGGTRDFYEENIGGFMNSLDPDFVRSSEQGKARAGCLRVVPAKVATLRLDTYTSRHDVSPDFMKIDVEGSELAVLAGAQATLAKIPALMVEVTRNTREVFTILRDHGFCLSDENGVAITDHADMRGNVFAERKRRQHDMPDRRQTIPAPPQG